MTPIKGARRKREPSLSLSLCGEESTAGQKEGRLEKGKVWSRLNSDRGNKGVDVSFPTVLPHLPLTDRVKSLFLWGQQVSKSRAGDWLARPGSARLHPGYNASEGQRLPPVHPV